MGHIPPNLVAQAHEMIEVAKKANEARNKIAHGEDNPEPTTTELSTALLLSMEKPNSPQGRG